MTYKYPRLLHLFTEVFALSPETVQPLSERNLSWVTWVTYLHIISAAKVHDVQGLIEIIYYSVRRLKLRQTSYTTYKIFYFYLHICIFNTNWNIKNYIQSSKNTEWQ